MDKIKKMNSEQLFEEYLRISNRIQVYSNSKKYIFNKTIEEPSYQKDIAYRQKIKQEMIERMEKGRVEKG